MNWTDVALGYFAFVGVAAHFILIGAVLNAIFGRDPLTDPDEHENAGVG